MNITPLINAGKHKFTSTLNGKGYDAKAITVNVQYELIVTVVVLVRNTSIYKINIIVNKIAQLL